MHHHADRIMCVYLNTLAWGFRSLVNGSLIDHCEGTSLGPMRRSILFCTHTHAHTLCSLSYRSSL